MKKHRYIENINEAQLEHYCIVLKEEYYSRTASGKSWKAKPESVDVGTISPQEYYNHCDAIPFFKNLGGSERVVFGYTYGGYLVTRITSVSPDNQTKVIRKFWIVPDEDTARRVYKLEF